MGRRDVTDSHRIVCAKLAGQSGRSAYQVAQGERTRDDAVAELVRLAQHQVPPLVEQAGLTLGFNRPDWDDWPHHQLRADLLIAAARELSEDSEAIERDVQYWRAVGAKRRNRPLGLG